MLDNRQTDLDLRVQRRNRDKVFDTASDPWADWQDAGEPIGDVLPGDAVELMAGLKATIRRQGYLAVRRIA